MVEAGSPVYLLTLGGLLKMVQICCAAPSLVLLASAAFNHTSSEFEMEHGDVSLTMTVFAFATSACIITVTILNGSAELPQMQLYRMNYAIGALALAINTVLFYVRSSSSEPAPRMHEEDAWTIPFGLCVANTVAHALNYVYAVLIRKPATTFQGSRGE